MLYLSKQFSGERTSSAGGASLHGGDSMVNIVEFEQNTSPQSRGRRIENNSILSTPFRHDEPSDIKLNFKKQLLHASQSMLQQHSKDGSTQGPGQESFHTRLNTLGHFKTGEGTKIDQIKDNEAEFMQVLSGCDTSNESQGNNIKKLHSRTTFNKTPGMKMMAGKKTMPLKSPAA